MAKAKTCAWPGCDRDISDRGPRAVRCKEHAAEWTRNRSRRAAGSEGREVNGDATAWREAATTQSTRVDSVSETALVVNDLPLAALAPSGSRAQAVRRGRFEAEGIAELAASIRSVGIVQPLVVRVERAGIGFEIVAGERRWLAAKEAGLERVPCIVRHWDDERAAVAQLVENLQRADLEALAEAQGYGTLRQAGWDAPRIAKEVGRSKSHVYGRLQLLGLAEGCRTALANGEINATTARTLCRVPASLQDDALTALREEQDNYTTALTTREIEDVIDWNFRRRIDDEPEEVGFDPQDAKLVALAFGGELPAVDAPLRACTACEWNTSHNRALGGRKGMCAHPACHAHKQQQHADAMASAFEGEVVLATAKKQFATTTNTTPNRAMFVSDGWEIESLRRRAKRPLPDVLFVCKDPARQGPRAFKVLRRKEAEAALPKSRAATEDQWERKRKAARQAVARVAELARPLFEGEPTAEQERALLRFVAQEFRRRAWSSTLTEVGKRWEGAKDVPLDSLCPDDAALRRFMLDLALTHAFDSADRDGAQAFAEACGLAA